jgi:hypothetical protein
MDGSARGYSAAASSARPGAVRRSAAARTLVTSKLNPKLSNASWDIKRAAIAQHSVLRLNHTLLEQAGDIWNEQAIANRGRRLAGAIIAVWPRRPL